MEEICKQFKNILHHANAIAQRYDCTDCFCCIRYIQQTRQFSLSKAVSIYQRHTQAIKMQTSEKIHFARVEYISWVSQINGREDIDFCRRQQEVILKQAKIWIESKNRESFKARDFDHIILLNFVSPNDIHIMKVGKNKKNAKHRATESDGNNVLSSISIIEA